METSEVSLKKKTIIKKIFKTLKYYSAIHVIAMNIFKFDYKYKNEYILKIKFFFSE